MLRAEADEVACILTPAAFQSVGEWYQRFEQTSDTEVSTLLARTRARERAESEITQRATSAGAEP